MRTRVKRIWSHGSEAYQVEAFRKTELDGLGKEPHWCFIDCYSSLTVAKYFAEQMAKTGIGPDSVVAEYGSDNP